MKDPLRKILKPFQPKLTNRDQFAIWFLSALFSFFLIYGRSFQLENSWDHVLKNPSMSVALGISLAVIFRLTIPIIWTIFDQLENKQSRYNKRKPKKIQGNSRNPICWILKKLDEYPFWAPFLFLVIAYLPYFVAYYPGIFMGDTPHQIVQAYNLPEPTSDYLQLIDENIKLNQHHPVAHTLFLHSCLVVGTKIFQSWNTGIFLYSVLQAAFFFSAAGYGIKTLKEYGVRREIRFGLLLYFVLYPKVRNFVFLVSKDTIYASFFLLFSITFLRFLEKGYRKNKEIPLFFFSVIGVALFRNDAKYILFLVFLVASIIRSDLHKYLVCLNIAILIMTNFLTTAFLPSMNITQTSRREALSVPFQQTARYLRDVPKEEITEEEWQSINQILNAEKIPEDYNPERSDAVKNTFREGATPEEVNEYLKTWRSMLWKHPEVYVQATMNNLYGYFAPVSPNEAAYGYNSVSSSKYMEETSKLGKSLNMDFHHSEALRTYRILGFDGYVFLFNLPIIRLILMPFLFVWVLFLWIGYALAKRKTTMFLAATPYFSLLLACMAGPCNGWYYRYMFPLMVCIPIMFFATVKTRK